MNESENVIEAKIINSFKALGIMLGWEGITLPLIIFVARHFNLSPAIGIISGLIVMILPVIYPKSFRSSSINPVTITFNRDDFMIQFWSYKKDALEKQVVYKYEDIKSCYTNPKRDPFSGLIMKVNKKTVRYAFFDDKSAVNSSEIVFEKLSFYNQRRKQSVDKDI